MLSESNFPISYPHRTDTYTARVPTPPRIVVPPPALNADALPVINLGTSTLLPPSSSSNDAHSQVTASNQLEWTYERRREAQMILPHLYLGPMTVVKDEAFIRSQGITMALGVRQKHGGFQSKIMDGAQRRAAAMGLEVRAVEARDNADLIHDAFPAAATMISEHLTRVHAATGRLGRVLVFCESGNERSAGVVAAYLMETHTDVDYIKAMQLCQAQRFCVNFDDAMKRLLQGYWDILCARRAVERSSGVANGRGENEGGGSGAAASWRGQAKAKRGLDRDEDDGMEGLDGDDLERFDGRSFAPFVDMPL